MPSVQSRPRIATVAVRAAEAQRFVTLTPRGALHAFGDHDPMPAQRMLATLLGTPAAPSAADWTGADSMRAAVLEEACQRGWTQPIWRPLAAPAAAADLEGFLASRITHLSGSSRAVLASDGGARIAHGGYPTLEAELMSAMAADVLRLIVRQRSRRFQSRSRAVSFFGDEPVLLPDTTFVPFWVGDKGFCLILDNEPLLNNRALIDAIWALVLAADPANDSRAQSSPGQSLRSNGVSSVQQAITA